MIFGNVSLITDDVRALARFYERVFQIDLPDDDTHIAFAFGGCTFVLYAKSASEADMGADYSVYDGTGRVLISFQVDDVDAQFERIQALGVPIVAPPKTHWWGSRSFQFRDPDGHVLNFVQVFE